MKYNYYDSELTPPKFSYFWQWIDSTELIGCKYSLVSDYYEPR